jgi:hypothetical protein
MIKGENKPMEEKEESTQQKIATTKKQQKNNLAYTTINRIVGGDSVRISRFNFTYHGTNDKLCTQLTIQFHLSLFLIDYFYISYNYNL